MPQYTEEQVQRAFATVREWDASQIEARTNEEMGREVMGLLGAIAKSGFPNANDDELQRVMHVMVLSFLLRAELEKKP